MTDNDSIDRIQQIRNLVESRKSERMRLEAREESLKSELEEFKVDLKSKGIDPTELDSLLASAKTELDEALLALERKFHDAPATVETPTTA